MKKIPKSDFKHGMRATCEVEGEKVDGRIAFGDVMVYFCSDDKRLEGPNKGAFGYKYSWSFMNIEIEDFYEEDGRGTMQNLTIYPESRDIMDVQYGDIIERQGTTRKVLAVIDEIVFISQGHDTKKVYDYLFSKNDLMELGYKIKQELPKQTFTKKQIADKLGMEEEEFDIIND